MKLFRYITLASALLLSSCAYFMEERPISFEGLPLKENEQLNYCPTSPDQSLVSSNPYAAQIFQRFLSKVQKENPKLKFIDRAVMWSLFQLNIRPDATSVYSGLQLIYKIEGETFHWNIKKKKEGTSQATYLFALQEILKKHNSQYTLNSLAKIMDKDLSSIIPIGATLSNFLAQNASELKNYESFKRVYFKATQVLNPRESLPRLLFGQLVRSHRIPKESDDYLKVDHMFQSHETPSLSCSFDINAYEHSIYIVSREKMGRHNNFGISEGKDNTFLAVTHYRPELKPYRSSYLFQGSSVGHQSALCHYKNNGREIYILSGQGRDPGQFIHQFMKNDISSLASPKDIDHISRQARLLKLYSPDRILVESHRASDDLLASLHLLERPIYHASNLGELTFWTRSQDEHSFVTDSRSSTGPQCQN